MALSMNKLKTTFKKNGLQLKEKDHYGHLNYFVVYKDGKPIGSFTYSWEVEGIINAARGMGRTKTEWMAVKGKAEYNPDNIINFITKKLGENKVSKKKEKLDEGMVMLSNILPVGGVVGLNPKKDDNFEFKGWPQQFDENGDKILDNEGNKIEIGEAYPKDTIHTSGEGSKNFSPYFPIRLTPIGNYTQMSFGFGNDSSYIIKLKGEPKVNQKRAEAAVKKAFIAFEKEIAKLGKIEDFK
jgi:hypothetical protein